MVSVPRYGVTEQRMSATPVDRAVEQLALAGCTVADGGYTDEEMDAFARAFEHARTAAEERHGGRARLAALDEHNTIRIPMLYDRLFLRLATNEIILEIPAASSSSTACCSTRARRIGRTAIAAA